MKTCRYKKAVKNKEDAGIILRISDDIRITPVLVAKFVMEGYLIEQQDLKIREFESGDSYLKAEDVRGERFPTECKSP